MLRLGLFGVLLSVFGCQSPGGETFALKAEVLSVSVGQTELKSGECVAPEFVEGKFYSLGTQVVHQGKLYTAVHENNAGYDPAAWGWFWTVEQQCD